MRHNVFAALFMSLLAIPATALAAVTVDWVVLSIDYKPCGNQGCNGGWPSVGWMSWEQVATVSGDAALGESPDDVTSACNRQWLQSNVGSASWNGTEWTLDVHVRAYDDGNEKSGACGVFVDFENEGVVTVTFEE